MRFAILCLLCALPCAAQGRPALLVGASGGESFGNLSLGPTVEVKLPIRRFELDLRDTFDPLESHIALGHGWDNVATIEPILWLKPNFGLDGRVDWSEYHVTQVSKHSPHFYAGIATRGEWLGAPVRVMLDYFREFDNGVYGHGIETSHLQGGSMYLEAQIGCSKHACYYTTLEMAIGGLLEQGNPQCDGSFGRATCPRPRNVSGSGIMGFLVSF